MSSETGYGEVVVYCTEASCGDKCLFNSDTKGSCRHAYTDHQGRCLCRSSALVIATLAEELAKRTGMGVTLQTGIRHEIRHMELREE